MPSAKRGIAGGTVEHVQALGAAWAYDWGLSLSKFNHDFDYVPMIRRRDQIPPAVDLSAHYHHGLTYLVFNEPDLHGKNSDGYDPAAAATLYHDLKIAIRAVDPTTRFIVGGTFYCQYTGWLAQFVTAYQAQYLGTTPPVAGVHVHHYAQPDYNAVAWQQQLLQFKRDCRARLRARRIR